MSGRLVLVATPLGNMDDLSPRALKELSEADAWIAEDTRVSGRLQVILGLHKPMMMLNDHTPPRKLSEFANQLAAGKRIALVTDAGTPGISDPGADLVDLCHEQDVEVESIPGPSAPTVALSLSGFYAQRYAFLGFLPKKPGDIKGVVGPFAESTLTLVMFESPFRIFKLLPILGEVLGSRRYAVARELTKLHQQIYRGVLPDLPPPGVVPEKGEFTLVVEGVRRSRAEP